MTEKKPKANSPTYVWMYARLIYVARQHGYALALHGSLGKDADFLAMAWTEEASSPTELVEAFKDALQDESVWLDGPELKPHGRRAWGIHYHGGGGYLDVSVVHPGYSHEPSEIPDPS